jgi:hypothetical protein
MLVVLAAVSISLTACSKPPQNSPAAAPAAPTDQAGHSHDGWWCDPHGVPEEVCALCNAKVAADFQAKGDWCKEHDRPESQCFICHPERQAEYAAQYEAKYGKPAPKPEGI